MENKFKPYEKVLVRDAYYDLWCASYFSHMEDGLYRCSGMLWNECIPYEGNEHLLGTSKPCETGGTYGFNL